MKLKKCKIMNNINVFKRNVDITVITHDGLCHSDDCMSVALVSLLAEKLEKKINVIRTRDKNLISEDAIVIDVFGSSLDHHQMEEVISGGRALASLGKVWRWAKELILELFQIDKISWHKIDQELIKPIDITDNTGVMNPWNYMFNSVRITSNNDWEVCLEFCKGIFKNILKSESIITKQREEFKNLPIETIFDLRFKISDHYVKPDYSVDDKSDGLVFPSNSGLGFTVILKRPNQFSKKGIMKGEIPGIIFTHKGGWIAEVEELKDLNKIL